MKRLLMFQLALILLCLKNTPLFAQNIIRCPDTASSLENRWNWGAAEARKNKFENGYWAGYCILHAMGERSFIGSISSDRRRNRPSLEELLTGMEHEYRFDDHSLRGIYLTDGMINFDDEKHPKKKVYKEVGILFHLVQYTTIDEIKISNLSLHVDLDNDPLFWLGSSDYSASVSFLTSIFQNTNSSEIKKHLIMAIGLHDSSAKAIEFLKKTLRGIEHPDIRGESAFWLGQTNTDDTRNFLIDVARTDHSEDVREKAIFALSEMEGPASTEALIDIAKSHVDDETRKKAIFWLGQKASDKTLGTLKDIAYNDEDVDVQRSAVFALTQFDDEKSVNELIAIAKNHPNARLRRQAIFWLGQNENPKALEALIEIVRK